MKSFSHLLTLSIVLLVAQNNSFASQVRLSQKINNYAEDLKKAADQVAKLPNLYKQNAKVRSKGYFIISQAVRIYQKESSEKLLSELLRYSAEFSLLDPTKQVGKYLLPLWKTHPKQIIEVTQSFPKVKRIALRRQIKAALDLERSKN